MHLTHPHSCSPEQARGCHRNPVGARLRDGGTFFQPKDLGWLDSCDKHRNEVVKKAPRAIPRTTIAVQPQISDCSQTLSNHRHAVKDYFPIFVIFILIAGFAPSSVTYYTQHQAVSTRGESSW